MSTFRCFEDIEAWQKARELTNRIYEASNAGSFARDFGLRDQIRAAATSMMSNIAEGFERGGTREFIQFLSIAKGSCGEVRSQLYVALDQGYLPKANHQALCDASKETGRLIGGLMKYLQSTELKGIKFKS